MAYVDYTYYTEDYVGEPVDETDFPRYEARASEAIDAVTRYQITGIDNLDSFTQGQVKKAVCAQVEYYASNGINLATDGFLADNFTIGKFSANYGTGQSKNGANTVCVKAISLLEQTGLLNRQVQTVGQPFLYGGW